MFAHALFGENRIPLETVTIPAFPPILADRDLRMAEYRTVNRELSGGRSETTRALP
jgi:hypothetical protein